MPRYNPRSYPAKGHAATPASAEDPTPVRQKESPQDYFLRRLGLRFLSPYNTENTYNNYLWFKELKCVEPIGSLTLITLCPEKMDVIESDMALTPEQRMKIRRLDGAIYKFGQSEVTLVIPSIAPVQKIVSDTLSVTDDDASTARFTTLPGGMTLRVRRFMGEVLFATDNNVGGFSEFWRWQVTDSLRFNNLLIDACGITAGAQWILDFANNFSAATGAPVPAVGQLYESIQKILSHPEDAKRDAAAAHEAKEAGVEYIPRIENTGIDVIRAAQAAIHAVVADLYAAGCSDVASAQSFSNNIDNFICLLVGDIGHEPNTMHVFQIVSGRKCVTNRFRDEFVLYVRSVRCPPNSSDAYELDGVDTSRQVFNPAMLTNLDLLSLFSTTSTVLAGIYAAPILDAEQAQLVLSRGYTCDVPPLASPLSNGETVVSLDGSVLQVSSAHAWRRLVTRNSNSIEILVAELWKLVRTEQAPTDDCKVNFGTIIWSPRTMWDMYPVSLINYLIDWTGSGVTGADFVQYGLTTPEFARPQSGLSDFVTATAFPLSSSVESFGYSTHIFYWVSQLFMHALSPYFIKRAQRAIERTPLVADHFFNQLEHIRGPAVPYGLKSDAVNALVPVSLKPTDQKIVKNAFSDVLKSSTVVDSKVRLADTLAAEPNRLAKIVDHLNSLKLPLVPIPVCEPIGDVVIGVKA